MELNKHGQNSLKNPVREQFEVIFSWCMTTNTIDIHFTPLATEALV